MNPPKSSNSLITLLINSPFGSLMGKRQVVFTVKGRRSGNLISTPVSSSHIGDSFIIVSSIDRTWWRSLRVETEVTLRNRGNTFTVKGQVPGDQGRNIGTVGQPVST